MERIGTRSVALCVSVDFLAFSDIDIKFNPVVFAKRFIC